MSCWASKVRERPRPEQRLKALADYYKTQPPSKILSEALGCYDPMLVGTPLDARPLIEHTMVVCVDTESYTMNTDQMTELGLVHVSRNTAKGSHPPGPHGWKLQEALRFLHFRVVEHAHLKTNRAGSQGPLGNRFGTTMFASFAEMRLILDDLFNQNIETDDPDLEACKRPVILVGHALRHDTEATNKPGLQYDLDANLTLVAKIDTQALARETRVWVPPVGMETNEIGLKVLIEKLGFQHVDDHTACNDAARTMMCAIHMVLPGQTGKSGSPSMQAVADRVEAKSKTSSGAPYGTAQCCIRCAARDHSADECGASVRCAACDRFVASEEREATATTHVETYCQRVAKFKVWLRRYHNARLKGRPLSAEVAAGPGVDAHPWSTWPGSSMCAYPFDALNDALVGLDLIKYNSQWREPAQLVFNMQAALGGIPVPCTGVWVPVSSDKSAAGQTAAGQTTDANGASVSARASSPRPAPGNSAAPGLLAVREVTMSASRGRRRHGRGQGHSRGGLDRSVSRSGGRDDGAGDGSWNPAEVW